MAVLKQRLHKKNSSGYDIVYLETRADLVYMTDGTTLLSAKINTMDTTIAGKAASSHTHSEYAASSHNHAAGNITSGTLAVARGGTGQTSLDLAVGTAGARAIYAGTGAMTAGTTALTTGRIYLQYE